MLGCFHNFINKGSIGKPLVPGSLPMGSVWAQPKGRYGALLISNKWKYTGPVLHGSGGLKLSISAWNITSLLGKEPKLEQEVKRYWLEIVTLISMQSLDFGTSFLERGWTLSLFELS